eukprot:m.253862 g.253862  ORF g.253862 m.253862 type:complete len:214 (+) comp18576_c0_seq1:397-1038(+)
MAGSLARIVLTGGPCGGKTSFLPLITADLQAAGVTVLKVPEAATLLAGCGALYPGSSPAVRGQLALFEEVLMKMSMNMEDSILRLAQMQRDLGHNVVVLFDRGLLDIKAYVPADLWTELLARTGLQSDQHIMSRYDMVVHLTTAANGAESFYSTDNNAARTETAEKARALDEAVKQVWLPHARHVLVPNTPGSDSLARKMAHAIEAIKDVFKL